eukprot:g12231.t1
MNFIHSEVALPNVVLRFAATLLSLAPLVCFLQTYRAGESCSVSRSGAADGYEISPDLFSNADLLRCDVFDRIKTVEIPGKAQRGDFTKSMYEFYAPLIWKIVEMDHGGDLSRIAFFGQSEGGAPMFELPLLLMYRKITEEVEKHKHLGVKSVQQLLEKVLTSKEMRRPFCVAGAWGSDTMPRPESVQGAYNWKRLTDVATICGDLMIRQICCSQTSEFFDVECVLFLSNFPWSHGVNVMDTAQYSGLDATYDPLLVYHQLSKIASAGFSTVEAWDFVSDHSTHKQYWTIPDARRKELLVKLDDEECNWKARGVDTWKGYLYPYHSEKELHAADPFTGELPDLWQAEVQYCHATSIQIKETLLSSAAECDRACKQRWPKRLLDQVQGKTFQDASGEGDPTGNSGYAEASSSTADDLNAGVGTYALYGRAFGISEAEHYMTGPAGK